MNNLRILKNPTSSAFKTNSYGKIFSFNAKSSLTINDSQADKIAEELLYRYGFLKDITPPVVVHVETAKVIEKNHKGKPVVRNKKIVKKAEGVKS